MVGVLARVANRKDPKTVLGPIDLSCSFVVVVSKFFRLSTQADNFRISEDTTRRLCMLVQHSWVSLATIFPAFLAATAASCKVCLKRLNGACI
jgi:hypothetical protein